MSQIFLLSRKLESPDKVWRKHRNADSQQIVDSFLLSTIDPTSKDQEQELPGLQYKFHMTPDGCVIMEKQQHSESAARCQSQPTMGFRSYI